MGKPCLVLIMYLLIIIPVHADDNHDLPVKEGEIYIWKETVTRNYSYIYTLEYEYKITILSVNDENVEFERKVTLIGGDIDLYNEKSENPDLTLYDIDIYSDYCPVERFRDYTYGFWIPLSQEFLNEWRTEQPGRRVVYGKD